VIYQGAPESAALHWKGADGYPSLTGVDLSVNGMKLHGEAREPFFRFDLLDRVSMPLRSVLASRTRPRLLLARASFTLEPAAAGGAPRTLGAVVKVDYPNPIAGTSPTASGGGA
jgi:hypothetical protein